ncbi:hypothetical protein QYE76_005223 [Lolium multiflorum]|uniref:Uncharacterized protein n=1 Tax=Lolium multiflorum TaxID=4521 RepID=A0AAD8RTH2_LOLMU|nr:hypothetical protein QYE76_005223 [Lolium multiflorum]
MLLDANNFMLWKDKTLPHLSGGGLHAYLDGTEPTPVKTNSQGGDANKVDVANPALGVRREKYSAAATGRRTREGEKLSGRHKSAGEIPSRRGEIVAIVTAIELDFIGIIITIISTTSTIITAASTPSRCNILEAWTSVHTTFGAQSRANVRHIHHQLQQLRKEAPTTVQYMHKMNFLGDNMAATGAPITDDKIVDYIIIGLGPSFNSMAVSLTVNNKSVSYSDFYPHH